MNCLLASWAVWTEKLYCTINEDKCCTSGWIYTSFHVLFFVKWQNVKAFIITLCLPIIHGSFPIFIFFCSMLKLFDFIHVFILSMLMLIHKNVPCSTTWYKVHWICMYPHYQGSFWLYYANVVGLKHAHVYIFPLLLQTESVKTKSFPYNTPSNAMYI